MFRDLLRLLADAGFVEVQPFGSLAREPFRLGSPGFWAAARKPA